MKNTNTQSHQTPCYEKSFHQISLKLNKLIESFHAKQVELETCIDRAVGNPTKECQALTLPNPEEGLLQSFNDGTELLHEVLKRISLNVSNLSVVLHGE